MLFRESFITDNGANILARAAAGNGAIVWTRAATSNANTDADSDSAMNGLTDITKTTADSYTSSGIITNAIVNDEQKTVAIYSELTNEEYDGAAYTFGAWAKIQGDEEDTLVIVARCGGATPTFINPSSEGVVKAFVDFSLMISAEQAQAIEAAEGYYATAAALQDEIAARVSIAGRTVTTHSAGDDQAGDDQAILGKKSFNDEITVGQVMPNGRQGQIGDQDHQFQGIYALSVETPSLTVKQIHKQEDETGVEIWADTKIRGDVTITETDGTGVGNINANLTGNVTGDVTGRIPTPTKNALHASRPTIPVGAIVLMCVMNDSQGFTTGNKIDCGVDLSAGGGISNGIEYTDLYVANIKTESHDSSNEISLGVHSAGAAEAIEAGTFRTLSHGSTAVNTNKIFVMAMRIE